MFKDVKRYGLLLIALFTLIRASSAFALQQGQTNQGQANPPEVGQTSAAQVFDPDAPPQTRTQLLPYLTFGGQFELEFEFENNFDFDDSEDEDVSQIEPELSLAFSFDPSKHFQAFLDTELAWELELEEGESAQRTYIFRITQAYILLKDFFDDRFSIQVGRQRFDDNREWLYDEELDAVRVFYDISDFSLELSASRLNFRDRDLLNPDTREKINNYVAYGSYQLFDEEDKEVEIAAYAVIRDDRSDEENDPIFFGLHSDGEIGDLEYWFEMAHVRGEDGSEKISGFGFDIGAFYEFDFSLEPSITVAYAFGTGDDDPDDDADKSFRQTGLQENEDKFNGVTSFKYYGELLDPELSNLSIFTVGIGIKPTKDSSVDFVYHCYLQHKASEDLRDVSIDADPNGRSKDLGSEIDLIIGYEEIRDIELALALGYFIPGKAFPESDNAFFAKLEIQFNF